MTTITNYWLDIDKRTAIYFNDNHEVICEVGEVYTDKQAKQLMDDINADFDNTTRVKGKK
jgi:hypothetical protein